MATTLPRVDDDPTTRTALLAGLVRVHEESVAYWSGYDDAAFFAPMGEHWSAADHVRHLTKSMRPVAAALRLPGWALRILFGRPRAPSRGFDALRGDYHGVLAAGGQAGRFAPRPLAEGSATPGRRARIMAAHAAAVDALTVALARLREDSLDRLRLPHPLLGRLTLREMTQFTLYHNLHHVHVAERRRRETAGA